MRFLRIISIVTLALPISANASQIKLATDNTEIVGKISVIDVNRLSLVGDRIRSVKTNKFGYEFINDEASGDVYIRALPDNTGDPLNAFVISEKGYTYKLLLTPVNIPSEQIFIKNPAIIASTSKKEDAEPLPYKQELIDLVKAMGQGEILSGYQVKTMRGTYPTSDRDLKMKREIIYEGDRYIGTIYQLKNTSKEEKGLSEASFASAGIMAIKFDKLVLEPRETINVYMVEAKK